MLVSPILINRTVRCGVTSNGTVSIPNFAKIEILEAVCFAIIPQIRPRPLPYRCFEMRCRTLCSVAAHRGGGGWSGGRHSGFRKLNITRLCVVGAASDSRVWARRLFLLSHVKFTISQECGYRSCEHGILGYDGTWHGLRSVKTSANAENSEGCRAECLPSCHVVSLKITVTLCRLVNTYHRFEGTCFLHIQGGAGVAQSVRDGRPGRFTPGTHWIGGWVDPRAGMDNVEKRKFLTLPGLELRPLGHPARS
jgi:hypothetical protein